MSQVITETDIGELVAQTKAYLACCCAFCHITSGNKRHILPIANDVIIELDIKKNTVY